MRCDQLVDYSEIDQKSHREDPSNKTSRRYYHCFYSNHTELTVQSQFLNTETTRKMRPPSFTAVFCAVLAVAVERACPTLASTPRVILVATLDDFGYASASFNQESPTWETSTPHMDALANSGVILRRAYCHTFCSPSRSSFLSGRLPVHVQLGNVQPDMPNAGVPAAMTTLPQKLSAAGWRCHGMRGICRSTCRLLAPPIGSLSTRMCNPTHSLCSRGQVGHRCSHAGSYSRRARL